jgi:DNA-binding ferritin-like protein
MPCDLSEIVAESQIDTGELSGDADFLLEMVRDDLEHLLAEFKELIEIASDEDLEEISNYAQDQALDIEKSLWMLNSTLG